ncbi:hypothetical protein THAOC_22263 [Thalassiosira oceanica]|uniref:DUF6820 domain-containing protein n=1 Tax=Thalassiosira oceanica TaxID=159749 RepID=K0S9T3_THAOC|nr:hypothetical protein THAOC_22263 [Thalassiosira oceanica]|eukprot:EJK57666.1 hypothetical protein THAOC_22263 [Thalassiosira oceanica]
MIVVSALPRPSCRAGQARAAGGLWWPPKSRAFPASRYTIYLGMDCTPSRANGLAKSNLCNSTSYERSNVRMSSVLSRRQQVTHAKPPTSSGPPMPLLRPTDRGAAKEPNTDMGSEGGVDGVDGPRFGHAALQGISSIPDLINGSETSAGRANAMMQKFSVAPTRLIDNVGR